MVTPVLQRMGNRIRFISWSCMIPLLLLSGLSCRNKIKQNRARDISAIVDSIATENVLMGSAVGITGEKPLQWKRFEVLQNNTSDRELVLLTQHTNATVRSYAFLALVHRNHHDIGKIVSDHLHDSATLFTLFGCIGGKEKVCDYFKETARAKQKQKGLPMTN